MKLLLLLLVSTVAIAQTPLVDNRSADEKVISAVDNRTPEQKAWASRLSVRQAAYNKDLADQKAEAELQRAEGAKQNAEAASEIAEAKRVQALVNAHNAVCQGTVPQDVYNKCIAEFQTIQPQINSVNEWMGRVNEWQRKVDVWAARITTWGEKIQIEHDSLKKEVDQYFAAIKSNETKE